MSSTDPRSVSKQMLLEKRLNRKIGAANSRKTAIPRRPPDSPMLASPGQARIWLLHHLDESSPGYNITSSFRLKSAVDLATLEWSLNQVVSRHEILRSIYHLEDSKIVQTVLDGTYIRIENPMFEDESDLLDAAHEFAQTPFNLKTGPLLKVSLFSKNPANHLLVLTIHDLIFDKWSLKIFWKELSEFYVAKKNERSADLPKLEIQFSDFAHWQRDWLKSGEETKQINYWKQKLSDPPNPIRFTTDYPFSDNITDKGKLQRSLITESTTSKLRDLATKEGCSLFMVLLLGFNILLRRYSNDKDILISSPVANRRKKETADLIGFFLNTIILRLQLDEGQSIIEALSTVKKTSLEALENQDVPLDSIVEAIKPKRVPGRLPLLQTMFIFQREDEGTPQLHLADCDIEPTFIETHTSKFELSLFVAESGKKLETIIEYRTDLFSEETIKELLDRYATLMENLATNPTQTLRELSILSEVERAQLSVFQKGKFLDLENELQLFEQIDRHSIENPTAIAVSMGESEITFADLTEQSNKIAARILDCGIERSRPVALYLDKSPAAINGLLGILKSGHAYLPVDPSYPDDRIQFIAGDADIGLVLTTKNLETTKHFPDITTINIDTHSDNLSDYSQQSLKGSDKAYIIYTSGTSGCPKGVVVSHENLRHSTSSRIDFYGKLPPKSLLIPSLSFDSSIATIFWTLATGGELVIPTSDELQNPDFLYQLVRKRKVSTILCVPTFYESLLQWDFENLKSLNTCIVAGESCPPRLVEKHFQKLNHAELYNEYGPTETSVWASVHKCEPQESERAIIPIGKPIANCEIRILTPDLLPVPRLHSGEIFIGGKGVSLGYLNRDELNKSKFLMLDQTEMFYRTGDLGRWNDEGEIEFLGRNDNQVKIRGYRIELEEVENVLTEHPNIKTAAAVASPLLDDIVLDDSTISRIIEEVGESKLQEIVKQIENSNTDDQTVLSSPEHDSRIVSRDKFRLVLEPKNSDFISPPRKAQRDWLIRQAMEEISDDLEHLDQIAKRFVAGKNHKLDSDLVDISNASLSVDEIMEDWQVPLMKEMARCATENRGDILEVGFGRGVSSEFIQDHDVRSHTIIEMNDACIENHFDPWKKRHPEKDIRLHHARWQDVEKDLGLFDGILFHAFPMNEAEFVEYVLKSVTFAEHSFPSMSAHLKSGGKFTYLTTEIDSFSRRHQRLLFKYFSEISLKVVPVNVPQDTGDTWWAESMVVVKAIK